VRSSFQPSCPKRSGVGERVAAREAVAIAHSPSGWRRPSIASRRHSVNSSRKQHPVVRECSFMYLDPTNRLREALNFILEPGSLH
jgi:hypothetical protein